MSASELERALTLVSAEPQRRWPLYPPQLQPLLWLEYLALTLELERRRE